MDLNHNTLCKHHSLDTIEFRVASYRRICYAGPLKRLVGLHRLAHNGLGPQA